MRLTLLEAKKPACPKCGSTFTTRVTGMDGEWAGNLPTVGGLPKRHCRNCGESFEPKKPTGLL